jgi:glycerate 2-kinase
LDESPARTDVAAIYRAVTDAVDPERLVAETLEFEPGAIRVAGSLLPLSDRGKLVVIAVGKAALPMLLGAHRVLGERIDASLAVTKSGFARDAVIPPGADVYEGEHPVPGDGSVRAGEAVLRVAENLTADDTVLMLISGGGSALLEAPVDGVTLDEIAMTTDRLLAAGADIRALNAVRRCLSRVKGGRLAAAIAPARVVNLVLSDVLGNPLPVIASGPTVAPEPVHTDVGRIVERLVGVGGLPEAVARALAADPGPASGSLANVVTSVVIADAATAATAAAARARKLGYAPVILGTDFQGEAREFARFWCTLARHAATEHGPFERPACLIGAGEMTVTIRGAGRGGRNTEMALAAALEIDGIDGLVVASLATDGDDGVSRASGGVVDGESAAGIRGAGIDPQRLLDDNDSATALAAAGSLLESGPTGTNVNDIYLALVT